MLKIKKKLRIAKAKQTNTLAKSTAPYGLKVRFDSKNIKQKNRK